MLVSTVHVTVHWDGPIGGDGGGDGRQDTAQQMEQQGAQEAQQMGFLRSPCRDGVVGSRRGLEDKISSCCS